MRFNLLQLLSTRILRADRGSSARHGDRRSLFLSSYFIIYLDFFELRILGLRKVGHRVMPLYRAVSIVPSSIKAFRQQVLFCKSMNSMHVFELPSKCDSDLEGWCPNACGHRMNGQTAKMEQGRGVSKEPKKDDRWLQINDLRAKSLPYTSQ